MKLLNFLAITLTTSATTAYATTCTKTENLFSDSFYVFAEEVDDVSGKCGGLWDNLGRFGSCTVTDPSCEAVERSDGGDDSLEWKFTVPKGCNGGHVESAWYEATKNEFGSISC